MTVGGRDGGGASIALDRLAAPARLARPARLYGVVVDGDGKPGQRRFLADLPAGAAVFALAAPGAAFELADRASSAVSPAFTGDALDASSVTAWLVALLSCPGLPRSTGEAIRLEAGERRALTAGAALTSRNVVWLRAAEPALRYPARSPHEPGAASHALEMLVIADQIGAELVAAAEVEAVETASLPAACLPGLPGRVSLELAAHVARHLVDSETAERARRRSAQDLDEGRASFALRRLREIAAARVSAGATRAPPDRDALIGALGTIGMAEGFDLVMPADDDRGAPLVERLRRFANATPFQFREIALTADWWREEGPAFLAIDAARSRPIAMVWRRGRWRAVDPDKAGDTVVDKAMAASLSERGYMFYASLPERLGMREILSFAAFGVRGDIARLLAASAAATLAGLLLPVATGAILGTAIPQARLTLLTDMLLLLGTTALGGAAFQVVRTLALIRLDTNADRRLQPAVWDRVVRLRASFFRDYSIGDLASRIMGISSIRTILSGAAVTGAISGVFSLASLALMVVYDATLAAFAAGYGVVAAILIFLIGRQQLRLERIVFQRKGIVSGLLIEMLRGIAKLRIAAAELRAFSRWAEAFAEQRSNNARSGRLAGFQTVLAGSLPILGAVGIFGIAAGGAHPIDVGSFAAFNSAFGQFTAALLAVSAALNSGIEVVPLFARVRPVFEAPLEVDRSRIEPGPLGGRLAIRSLSFRYTADGPWILQDIDLEVEPGECVAIVGASGSGKSTIMRLLLGFESPTRGGVYYDDRDLETLDLRLLRRQVGTVMESSKLVPGSLFENIAGGAPLTTAQVEEAVRLAGLEADVANMPMGLKTSVGEGTGLLSGGQRQRVLIARALVHKPRLIFFDEATSALDNRTQAIVGASLAETNATRIIIAHRLSTVHNADRILVLERGRIVEAGTYDELIARNGAFYRLARRQLL